MAWLSGGVSAHAFIDSWTDWAFHMGHSPGRQLELAVRVVATETDHIPPWRSVYKTQLFTDCDLTFVPTSGRHKSGIVNESGNPRSRFVRSHRLAAAPYVGPDDWLAEAEPRDGSWWPEWQTWLRGRSGGLVPAPATGAPEDGHPPLGPAPGSFLFQT
jgi:polyhydroxyalkanoate synthase